MTDWLGLPWKLLVVRGVVAVIFGIAAVTWPVETAMAFVLLWGIWAIADGIGYLAGALAPGPGVVRALSALMGVGAVVVGLLAIFSPSVDAATLTWVLGIWLIARGAVEAISAMRPPAGVSPVLLLASAAIDVVLGVLFVANPGRSALAIATLLGVVAIVWGVVSLGIGIVARRHDTVRHDDPIVA